MDLFSRLYSTASLIVLIVIILAITRQSSGYYTSIFSFGDSISDTGNLYASSYDPEKPFQCFLPPYGETFFHHPAGRCSNGRLIIDFLAEFFGLPYLRLYLAIRNDSPEHFKWGVNFAVAGATALDNSFFVERGIIYPHTNNSLRIQLDWFKELLPSLCPSYPDCSEYLNNSLFMMGEIGGNDYNAPLGMHREIEEIETFVPLVINTISSTIKELIKLGATTFMVPGNFPIGCAPLYLTNYESSNEKDYDPDIGCLIWLNKFSEFHNEQLQKELSQIQVEHPRTKIIYADYYNHTMHLYRTPDKFGFGKKVLTACCGGVGPYNFNSSAECGGSLASACDDPSSYVSWDGLHYTEATYNWIAQSVLEGLTVFEELTSAI